MLTQKNVYSLLFTSAAVLVLGAAINIHMFASTNHFAAILIGSFIGLIWDPFNLLLFFGFRTILSDKIYGILLVMAWVGFRLLQLV